MPKKPGRFRGEAPGADPEVGAEEREGKLPEEMEAVFRVIAEKDLIDDPGDNEKINSRIHYAFSLITEISDPKAWEAFIDRLQNDFMGKKNKDKWGSLSYQGQGYMVYGDIELQDFLMSSIAKSDLVDSVGKEEAHKLFVSIIDNIKDNHDEWIKRREGITEGYERYSTAREAVGQYRHLIDSDVSRLVSHLGAKGNRETADMIFELLMERVNSHIFFEPPYADALSSIDPAYAADKVFRYLKSKESLDRHTSLDAPTRNREDRVKRTLGKLLRRLEFGRIGISDLGVEYLNRLYRLSEKGQDRGAEKPADLEDFDHAERVSGDGDMGLFDDQGEMAAVFKLGDITDGRDTVDAVLHQPTLEMLFEEDPEETEEEKTLKKEVLDKYIKHFAEYSADEFFKNTSVQFNNLSQREQAWFIHFSLSDDSRREAALELVKQHGESGLRTFLSLEYDSQAGDKIFNIAHNPYDESSRVDKEWRAYYDRAEIVGSIFAKYNQLVLATNEIEREIQDFFVENNHTAPSAVRVTADIMKRAGKILTEYADKDLDRAAGEEIVNELSLIQRDVIVFGFIFRNALKLEGKLDLKEIKALNYKTITAEALRSDESLADTRDKMIDVVKANYEGVPHGKAEGPIKEVTKLLTEEGDSEFYVLTRDTEDGDTDVVSFVRYDMPEGWEGSRYGGSFNTNPKYRDYGVGYSLLDQSIQEVGQKGSIEAQVYAELSAGTRYVEDFDFVIDDVTVRKQKDRDRIYFWVRRDNNLNKELKSKDRDKYPVEKIKSMVSEDKIKPDFLLGEKKPDILVRCYEYKKEQERIGKEAGQLIEAGYAVSRYFTDPEDKGKRYFLFEKLPRFFQD